MSCCLICCRNYDITDDEGDISDMLNVSLFGVLQALQHPSVQTYGVRYVFDLTGMRRAHINMMLTRLYYLKASRRHVALTFTRSSRAAPANDVW